MQYFSPFKAKVITTSLLKAEREHIKSGLYYMQENNLACLNNRLLSHSAQSMDQEHAQRSSLGTGLLHLFILLKTPFVVHQLCVRENLSTHSLGYAE